MPPPRRSSFVRRPRPSFVIPDSDQGTLPLVVPAEAGTQVQGADAPGTSSPTPQLRRPRHRWATHHQPSYRTSPAPHPKTVIPSEAEESEPPIHNPGHPAFKPKTLPTVVPDPIRNPGAGRRYHPKRPISTAAHDTQDQKYLEEMASNPPWATDLPRTSGIVTAIRHLKQRRLRAKDHHNPSTCAFSGPLPRCRQRSCC